MAATPTGPGIAPSGFYGDRPSRFATDAPSPATKSRRTPARGTTGKGRGQTKLSRPSSHAVRTNRKQHNMSNTTSDPRGNGQRRRRSRGGKNRNRNRENQDPSNPQAQRDSQRQGNHGDRRHRDRDRDRDGNRDRNRQRGPQQGPGPRAPKLKPLTWWQKLLKAIGLYKEPVAKAAPAPAPRTQAPVKENIRIAKPKSEAPAQEKDHSDRRRQRAESQARDVDSRRLYLGNLSYEATESDLEELFRGVGSVRRVEIVYNRRTHRSKGYGFIEMLDTDEAKKAVEILHDQFFMGRKLVVSSAKSEGPAETDDRPEDGEHEPAPRRGAVTAAAAAATAAVVVAEPAIETIQEIVAAPEEAPAAAEAAIETVADAAPEIAASQEIETVVETIVESPVETPAPETVESAPQA